MFDDAFLDSLPTEPEEALRAMCRQFQSFNEFCEAKKIVFDKYDEYVEALVAFEAFIEATGLPFHPPELCPERMLTITRISEFVRGVIVDLDKRIAHLTFEKTRDRFRTRFGTVFLYEFSDGDLARVQALVNELRDLITASELFDAKHKERILRRLEALQKEMHKKMSSIDKFWGLVGDAGVVLGKFGADAKPLVDRIKEIAQIVWRTQARAEELPSGTPLPLLSAPARADDTK